MQRSTTWKTTRRSPSRTTRRTRVALSGCSRASDQAIPIEGDDSSYINILAVRPELQDDPRIQKLFELLTSPEVAQFEQDPWGGIVVPVS
jgi:ABC-type metal ion transport system substrate-binding protein